MCRNRSVSGNCDHGRLRDAPNDFAFYCVAVPIDDAGRSDERASPWSPGADVEFVHPPSLDFVQRETDRPAGQHRGEWSSRRDPGTVGAPDRSRRNVVLAGVLGVAAVVTAFFVGRSFTEVPEGDATAIAERGVSTSAELSVLGRDLGGDVVLAPGEARLSAAPICAAQRLPSSIAPLWEATVAGLSRGASPATVGDAAVVVIAGLDDSDASTGRRAALVALDTATGEERWSAALQPSTGSHEIVGIVDGAVIVRSVAGPDVAYRRLFAFDEETGTVLWDRGFRGEWSAAVNPGASAVVVKVRRPAVSDDVESEIEVVEPRTGRRRHVAAGELVGLDADGRVVTRSGDKVLATSRDERTLVGVVVPSDSTYSLVGDEIVVASEESAGLTVSDGADAQRTMPVEGTNRIDAPGFILHLDTLGDSSVLVIGDRAVHGASVDEDAVRIRWRAMGVLLASTPTDRGRALLLALRGGAEQRVVDGSNGRTIASLELSPGALATLGIFANGIVVQKTIEGELRRFAFDLDGRELWSVPGSGPLAANAGLVVDVDVATSTDEPGSDDIIRAYSGAAGTADCAG